MVVWVSRYSLSTRCNVPDRGLPAAKRKRKQKEPALALGQQLLFVAPADAAPADVEAAVLASVSEAAAPQDVNAACAALEAAGQPHIDDATVEDAGSLHVQGGPCGAATHEHDNDAVPSEAATSPHVSAGTAEVLEAATQRDNIDITAGDASVAAGLEAVSAGFAEQSPAVRQEAEEELSFARPDETQMQEELVERLDQQRWEKALQKERITEKEKKIISTNMRHIKERITKMHSLESRCKKKN